MNYFYELTEQDIKNLSLEVTGAKEYSVVQNGWTGKFDPVYSIVYEETMTGELVGKKGKALSGYNGLIELQEEYIRKNCKCTEI